jgi:hypothetical protein
MAELRLTAPRRALLRAINDEPGRVYFEANQVWDKARYVRVTAIARYLVLHRLIRVKESDEALRPGEARTRIYYRLTGAGALALGVVADTKEGQGNG